MRGRQAGMTLLEVLIATAVLALMMVIAWGTVTQTMKARKHFGDLEIRNREARSALTRMAHDFEMAYLSGNEDRTLQETRTYFIADPSGDVQQVRFSAFAHTPLYGDAHESDQAIISYYPGPDPEDRRKTDLFRRETRRMAGPNGPEKWDQLAGEAEPLFTNIKKLKLFYWDPMTQEWKDSWSTQNPQMGGNKLPDRVKIQLVFDDENGKEVVLTTQARVYLQEVLQFFAN